MRRPLRPCIERLPDGRGCPEYAIPGKSRCETHQRQALKEGRRSPGTTAAWRKARKAALERAGRKCEKCGRTQDQARADGTWLEVHHVSGAGVRAKEHDPDDLQVLCRQPCHLDTWRAQTRQTWRERKAELGAKAEAEGRAERGE
jgi:5-methylcytosine-specific restriction endonuclease McrA